MNGNGWVDTTKHIASIVRDLGIGTVVILWFLGMFSGYIPSPLTQMRADLDQHRTNTELLLAAVTKNQNEQTRLLRVMCAGISIPSVQSACLQ